MRLGRNAVMKKALFVYDTAEAVAQVIVDIYDGMYEIDLIQDYGKLTYDFLKNYHTVILGAQDWDNHSSKETAAGLIRYVSCGGTVLAFGNVLQGDRFFEMNCLLGKKLIAEGSPCLLDLCAAHPHVITANTEEFKLVEHPCFYELDPILEPQVVLHLKYAGKTYPAAWCHTYGWGKVFCITVGNFPESYLPQIRKIFWRAGEWFLNRL